MSDQVSRKIRYPELGERITAARKLKGWSVKQLQAFLNAKFKEDKNTDIKNKVNGISQRSGMPEDMRTGKDNPFEYNQVWNWTKGWHEPETSYEQGVLAAVLGLEREELFGTGVRGKISSSDPVISIIEDRKTYREEREKIILSPKTMLWIQLRSASYIEESSNALMEIMRRGITVKLLACDPGDNVTMQMISRRKYRGQATASKAAEKIRAGFQTIRDDMRENNINHEHFIIRVTDFLPSTAMYISDPFPGLDNPDGGTLFAVIAAYKIDPYCAPVLLANSIEHSALFTHYRRQFILLWRAAKKYDEDQ